VIERENDRERARRKRWCEGRRGERKKRAIVREKNEREKKRERIGKKGSWIEISFLYHL
jgi:hypothetical protein